MFENPIGLAAANRCVTSGASGVRQYGGSIWDAMTYHGKQFTTKEIVAELVEEHGLAPRTAYSYVISFFAYCRAVPDDFRGPGSRLEKRGNRWRLADNPE